MKQIGLIGGMSWHSTAMYYQYINEEVNRRLGGQHSADIILKSLDFESLVIPWHQEKWEEALKPLFMSVKQLEAAGADFFLVCSNAVHKFSDKLSAETNIPMLHIGKVVSQKIQEAHLKTVGLLGTRVTMESDFYSQPLDKRGIKMLLPTSSDQLMIDELIFTELTKGKFTDSTRDQFESVIDQMKKSGAEGIILGCTELPILLSKTQNNIPLFDTTKLHSFAAVAQALE